MIPLLTQHPLVSLLTKYHIIHIFILNIAKKEGGGQEKYPKEFHNQTTIGTRKFIYESKFSMRLTLRSSFLKTQHVPTWQP